MSNDWYRSLGISLNDDSLMIYALVLLCVSGLIAYLGDVLGTLVGKRRLTILGIRPRITAIVVSISTGILITLLTLVVSALLSENVRIALFSVQQLTEERSRLASEVTSLNLARTKLQTDLDDLKRQVKTKEQERVVCRKDTPLAALVVKIAGRSRESVLNSVSEFIGLLSKKAGEAGLIVKSEKEFLAENGEEMGRLASHMMESGEDVVLAAIAAENKMFGEPLGEVHFLVKPNRLIFKADQEIATYTIDGSQDRGKIAKTLQDFMDEINHEVVNQGMFGNPLTERFGDFSSESMLSFYDMVNQIKELGRTITLTVVVKEDTYAIGPLNVAFRLEK